MGLFGGSNRTTVAGRAYAVPTGTRNLMGNENNFSADSSVRSEVHLVAVSAADGQPFVESMQKIHARLPNWVVIVLHSAGANLHVSPHLPERLEVPVTIDAVARTIVELDVEATTRELAPYRHVAVDHWKHTDSVLAPVRNVFKLPGDATRGIKGLLGEWKTAITDLADDLKSPGGPPKPSWTDAEIETMRREANILAYRWQKHPDERARLREAALRSLPLHVESLQAGAIHQSDFEAILMREEISTAITADEAAAFRRDAGLA